VLHSKAVLSELTNYNPAQLAYTDDPAAAARPGLQSDRYRAPGPHCQEEAGEMVLPFLSGILVSCVLGTLSTIYLNTICSHTNHPGKNAAGDDRAGSPAVATQRPAGAMFCMGPASTDSVWSLARHPHSRPALPRSSHSQARANTAAAAEQRAGELASRVQVVQREAAEAKAALERGAAESKAALDRKARLAESLQEHRRLGNIELAEEKISTKGLQVGGGRWPGGWRR